MSSRRDVLKSITAAAALGLPLSYLAGARRSFAASPTPITVTAFGGIWEETIRAVIVPDYEQHTGGKANVMIGGPQQWMAQIEANKARPPIDVLMNSVDLALIAGRTG